MWVREISKTLVILGSVSAVLLGCRAEERDRFVYYEPGKYKGKPDSVLSQKSCGSGLFIRVRVWQVEAES